MRKGFYIKMHEKLSLHLLEMIKNYPIRFFFALFLTLIGNVFLIVNPLLFRYVLQEIAPKDILEPFETSYFFMWIFLFLMIATFSALFKYWMRRIFFSLSREAETKMREGLFLRIHAHSAAFFDRHSVGDLLSRLTNDITAYRDMVGISLMYPSFLMTLIIPSLFAMFFLSPLMTFLTIASMIIIYFINFFIGARLIQAALKMQTSLSEMSQMAQEHYWGIKLIKSYALEERVYSLFSHLCHRFSKVNRRFSSLQSGFMPMLNMITRMTMVVSVIAAAGIILKGWGKLSVPDFLSFIWIQSYIFTPLLMLSWVIPIYHRGRAAYSRLWSLYSEPLEFTSVVGKFDHIPEKADIVLNNLTFHYPHQKKPAINSISLTIKGGTFIGITGAVGAGKTTLLRLINREYEIPRGVITIAGQDINDYSAYAFRNGIVTVEQLPFLFSKTIKENLAFGKNTAIQQEVEEAARLASIHNVVMGFPEQYETIVGEHGVTLSGGQKQRMAMARAFLLNRSILLLDDIFSALDSQTENDVFSELKRHFYDKTVILVTPRVSILNQLDRIIYMIEGKIVEEGSPIQLMLQKGPYRALVDLQREENERNQ